MYMTARVIHWQHIGSTLQVKHPVLIGVQNKKNPIEQSSNMIKYSGMAHTIIQLTFATSDVVRRPNSV